MNEKIDKYLKDVVKKDTFNILLCLSLLIFYLLQCFPTTNIMWDSSSDQSNLWNALYVNMFDHGSHSLHKGESTLCESSCMVAPTTKYIFLNAVWLTGNVKTRYLHHELFHDKFSGRYLTDIKPVIYQKYLSIVAI